MCKAHTGRMLVKPGAFFCACFVTNYKRLVKLLVCKLFFCVVVFGLLFIVLLWL